MPEFECVEVESAQYSMSSSISAIDEGKRVDEISRDHECAARKGDEIFGERRDQYLPILRRFAEILDSREVHT